MGKQRKRRSSKDMELILEKASGSFQDWAYIGDETLMDRLFPDLEYDNLHDSGLYFSQIKESCFEDAGIVQKYGENLRKIRKNSNFTLQEVATATGLHFQALQQIEEGHRKKINRDILLLLCGFYQVSPEVLMGIDEERGIVPMTFYPKEVTEKALYIVERLTRENDSLLDALAYFASAPKDIKEKMVNVLKNIPLVKVLNPVDMLQMVRLGLKAYDINEYLEALRLSNKTNLIRDYGIFCDLYRTSPEMLDLYVAVAITDRKYWNRILSVIVSAGFLPIFSCDETI